MRLWTFIADFMGGTYVSQCRTDDLAAALDWFALEQPAKRHFAFLAGDGFYDAVEVADTKSVWSTSFLDADHQELITLHIVQTTDAETPEG